MDCRWWEKNVSNGVGWLVDDFLEGSEAGDRNLALDLVDVELVQTRCEGFGSVCNFWESVQRREFGHTLMRWEITKVVGWRIAVGVL